MKKILVCAPTAAAKNYCAEEWLLNINKFTYPNFEVVVFDNTLDNGENANYLNQLAESLCLKYNFKAISIPVINKTKKSLFHRMADSHQECSRYAILNYFEHLLHLETDVMPEKDVIETLLSHKKQVVGALYYRDEGRSRKLMVQRHIYRSGNSIASVNLEPHDDVCFIDGTLKKVSHVGLGCCMIHKTVFSQIPFRYVPGQDTAPDVYFAQDCFSKSVPIFADTSLICAHKNTAWGKFGIDYN